MLEMGRNGNNFTPEQQLTILNLLACNHSTNYIKEHFEEIFDRELSDERVSYYRRNYSEQIKERKLALMQSIPIADRAWRLLMRMMLVEDIRQRGLWLTRYDAQGNAYQTGNHTAINQILDSAAKDQDDFADSSDSTVLKFKAILQLSGEDALNYLKTGKLPDLSEIRRLQAAQDKRSKKGE